jgi:hypothetical protein
MFYPVNALLAHILKSGMKITATFQDATGARVAVSRLGTRPDVTRVTVSQGQAERENRFIGRVVVLIVAWSIVGTLAGVLLGIVLAATVGPAGTEGVIIQAVSWAIFAHLVAGLCAGYVLLSDRTERELPVTRGPANVSVECANIDEIDAIRRTLFSLGAVTVERAAEGNETGWIEEGSLH